MSKGKKLLIYGAVLLILIAAVVVIGILQDNGIMPGGDSSVEEESSLITASTDYLLQHDKTEISTITVENDAVTYTLVSELVESENSSGTTTTQNWKLKEYEDWELTSSSISSLATIGYNLVAVKTVAEDKEAVDLANFGLADPLATVTIKYTDGSEATVTVGDTTPDGTYRYAVVSNQPGVYTVYKSVATYAEYDLTTLRSITINQIATDETLEYVYLHQKGLRPIELTAWGEDEEHEDIYDISLLKMVQPYADWDASVVSGNISDMYTNWPSITINKLVEPAAEDLDQYGLGEEDYEYHVNIITSAEYTTGEKDADGNEIMRTEMHEIDYYFGFETEDGLIYFRQGGSNDVYTVAATTIDSYDFEPFEYLQKLVYLQNIDLVDSYTVTSTADNLHYECSILRQDESEVSSTEESSAERLEVHYLNGKLVEGSPFRTHYQKVIGLTMDYEILEKPEYDESDKVTIVYNFTDGTSRTIEFYRLDEWYYVTPWGNTWMACGTDQFDLMWESFENLQGETE